MACIIVRSVGRPKNPVEMSFEDRDGVIWFDGNLVPWRECKVHLLTHTLHYGTGVFEGLRAYNTANGTQVFRLREHTDRLFNSAAILGMQIPFGRTQVEKAQCEVVVVNNLEEAYIRPICFFGCEEMGLHANNLSVHLAIAAWEWPPYLGPGAESGISMKTVSLRRMAGGVLNGAKAVGPYLQSVLAVREATDAGADEALLLDQNDRVAEGSGQNIFLVRDGRIITPIADNCLTGITRQSIMEMAAEAGMPVKEEHISLDDVKAADEVFVTGTASEVVHVRTLDDQLIADGKLGEITALLQKNYHDQVRGRRNSFSHWLTPVNSA